MHQSTQLATYRAVTMHTSSFAISVTLTLPLALALTLCWLGPGLLPLAVSQRELQTSHCSQYHWLHLLNHTSPPGEQGLSHTRSNCWQRHCLTEREACPWQSLPCWALLCRCSCLPMVLCAIAHPVMFCDLLELEFALQNRD